MKRNTFFLLLGVVAIIELFIFDWALEIHNPLPMEVAFVIGVVLMYLAKQRVTDIIEDERSVRITETSALRTLQVFWVVFFALSIGAVMNLIQPPRLPPPFKQHPPPLEIFPGRFFGLVQMGLLCMMIFLYVGFRIYYARKYGEWDTDEEQD
jgi:uncharacterized membrane protein